MGRSCNPWFRYINVYSQVNILEFYWTTHVISDNRQPIKFPELDMLWIRPIKGQCSVLGNFYDSS